MTPRMTVAISVLTIGLAVAALAGIPSLIENRAIGDGFMIGGFAFAILGVVLVGTAIPSQIRENRKIKTNADVDVDQLRIERHRLLVVKADVASRLFNVSAEYEATRMAGQTNRAGMALRSMRALEIENANLEAQIATNANEFRRLGVEPTEPGDS